MLFIKKLSFKYEKFSNWYKLHFLAFQTVRKNVKKIISAEICFAIPYCTIAFKEYEKKKKHNGKIETRLQTSHKHWLMTGRILLHLSIKTCTVLFPFFLILAFKFFSCSLLLHPVFCSSIGRKNEQSMNTPRNNSLIFVWYLDWLYWPH